jgi:hypothetical protein
MNRTTTNCLATLLLTAVAGGCSLADEPSRRCEADPVWVGDAEIHSASDLEELAGCVALKGDLQIVGTDLTDVDALWALESIQGNLSIKDNSRLESLAGLDGVEDVWGAVALRDNPRLLDVDHLGALWLAGSLVVSDNASLEQLEGLQGIEAAASVHVIDNRVLGTLAGLDVSVVGDLHVSGNAALARLDLERLEMVDGDVFIGDNPRLPTCVAEQLVERLIEAGFDGRVEISGNDDTQSCAL